MHTWWRAVCDEHKEVCDCFVNNPIRTAQLLGDKCRRIAEFFQKHWGCKLRLVHKDEDLDFLHENSYTFVLRGAVGGETKPAEEPDIIEVYEYEDHSGIDCPFTYDVESTQTRPCGCAHPKNECKQVNGVWEGDCGLKGGRDVIPEHCPLRRAPTIIRLRQGG